VGWDGLDRVIYTTDDLLIVLLIGVGFRDTKALLAQNEKILGALGVEGYKRIERLSSREIDEAREQ